MQFTVINRIVISFNLLSTNALRSLLEWSGAIPQIYGIWVEWYDFLSARLSTLADNSSSGNHSGGEDHSSNQVMRRLGRRRRMLLGLFRYLGRRRWTSFSEESEAPSISMKRVPSFSTQFQEVTN